MCSLFYSHLYRKGFEQGRFAEGKLQPFGERLQSPWATSENEAIAHGSVRKNPFQPTGFSMNIE